MERVVRVSSLEGLEFPDDAVLVVDDALRAYDWPRHSTIFVPAGESLKSLESAGTLAERVCALRPSRPLTLVAVGGGSVGDAVGFLASILWRGVALWHVPTTLLAAADSAFGGKTAVNHLGLKNQLGTFWPAQTIVLVDEILADIPPTLRAEGLAEIVKASWIGGTTELLDRFGVEQLAYRPWEDVGAEVMRALEAAIEVKRAIVQRDPREELGIRTLLNLGHTVGHALEAISAMSHGRAVAWGLASVAEASVERAGLPVEQAERLQEHVRPLLGTQPPQPDPASFGAAVRGDKKTLRGSLRSVLLHAAGDAFVTDDLSAEDWREALERASAIVERPLRVSFRAQTSARIEVESSKSELNRLRAIAALRPGPTTVIGGSSADDVRTLSRALETLETQGHARAGEGALGFRILVVLAAAKFPGSTISLGPNLSRRPHTPLYRAIETAGGAVTVESERLVRVGALPDGPVDVTVDVSQSSQVATAFALLGASGRSVTIRWSGEFRSKGYFELTLSLLKQAGVEVARGAERVVLRATHDLWAPVTLAAGDDASSAAVWRIARFLGVDVEVRAAESGQPDAGVSGILREWKREDAVRVDVGGCPDLVPVLAAAAALTDPAVTLFGAPHLRHKESDRIADLGTAFAAVGIDISALDDGVAISAGKQIPHADATFPTFGDHRLAMAGCLLALKAPLVIDRPHSVSKSYPEFWRDAAIAGFSTAP